MSDTMTRQFERVASELGWDVTQQIAMLETFVAGFGVSGRLADYLSEGWRQRSTGWRRRDELLEFLASIGAEGALSRVLQRALRDAALAREAERVRGAAAMPPQPPAVRAEPTPGRGLWRRWRGRPGAG